MVGRLGVGGRPTFFARRKRSSAGEELKDRQGRSFECQVLKTERPNESFAEIEVDDSERDARSPAHRWPKNDSRTAIGAPRERYALGQI